MEDTSQPLRRSSRKRTLRTTLQQEYQSEAVGETNATSKGTGKRVKKHKHIAAKGVPGINASEAVHNPNVEAECITGSGKVILSDFSEDHLLQQVLSNGTSLKVTLIQLEKTLKSVNSNLSAKKSIVEFLFHSCGCHTSVTEKEISSMSEIPTIVNRIAESITLLADEYPIVSKNKDLRKFSQRYSELWSMLPLTFSEDILINQGLLDFVFSWLNYMSTAPRLSFRHTACVAIFNLMSGIIKLSSQLKNRVELAGKITKSKRKKAADNDQIDSLKERIKSLDHISNSCFDKYESFFIFLVLFSDVFVEYFQIVFVTFIHVYVKLQSVHLRNGFR